MGEEMVKLPIKVLNEIAAKLDQKPTMTIRMKEMSSGNSDIPEADMKYYSLVESPLQHKNLNDTDTSEVANNVQAAMEQSEEFPNDCQVNSDKKSHVTEEKLSVELKVAFEELREQIKSPKNDEIVVKNHSVNLITLVEKSLINL